ncbi:MAG: pyrrolo-quinoline quinone [Clostridiales bacterium]|nr:MAG: pyrrolo-quinoline quinone [Clostridiales bacterium]
MKTSRLFRIFMMALDLIVMALLRPFRKFTKLQHFRLVNEEEQIPHATEATQPAVHGIEAQLEVDGQPAESYQRMQPVEVSEKEPYTQQEGIVTFRGDHLRSGAALGNATLKQKKLRIRWSAETGKLAKGYGKGFWTGSGWTGQPLILHWTQEQKQSMNLYEEKKQKETLWEVIYSTMDGNVYFLDLEDGTPTRDVLKVGLPFKGAGAVHPSLPILHLGPGDSGAGEGEYARAYLYSLEDCSKLLEYGGQDPFAIREFCGFDSSPLFFGDYIFEPSENGILYTFKLNPYTDEEGKLRIAPDEFVKLRYKTARSSEESYWLGMEDSPVMWKNYLYIADNGGTMLCVDVNTMRIVWTQDVVDDTNGSPVFSMEDGHPYLYIGTSLHWSPSKRLRLGDCPIFKLDAITGEYVWIRSYFCNTIAGISGGVQATPVLGKHEIEDLMIFPVARTPSVRNGIVVALDKKTGKEVWRYKMKAYAWSSPVAVYDEEGKAYLLQGDSAGTLHLLDARTGKLLDQLPLGANIEASPAVVGNILVVGTRGMKIFGIELL